jgi:O-succinylbenzoic acid--CoA ligase
VAGVSGHPQLLSTAGDPPLLAERLERLWEAGAVVALAAPLEQAQLRAALPRRMPEFWGGGVVLGTGGSSGSRRWCLQPLAHLQAAARATCQWLRAQNLEPAGSVLFNPLPLHHVSGLMPLVRARQWGASLCWLAPELMRDPARLVLEAPLPADRAAVLSLVPTQLQRLIEDPAALRWLAGFAVIWIGGAGLAPELADRSRQAGLRLAPCYGSTETGAMVCALAPDRFLAGAAGCGQPLPHAALRVAPGSGALQIQASSLAAGFVEAGRFEPLELEQGWWSSGDRALLDAEGLRLLGRLDGAINSGAETVFPEQVEQRLRQLAGQVNLPLQALLVLSEPDPLWGERLVALVRPAGPELLQALQALSRQLPPSQRPRRWLLCPELAPSALGKWERGRWRQWLRAQPVAEP